MVVKKSMLVFALTALLCGIGVSAEMQTNLITNPDMALDDGVGIPAGWGTRIFPAEMGGSDCTVCRREGELLVESQRYLKAGPHKLRIRNAKGGRLRIHAVKLVSRSRAFRTSPGGSNPGCFAPSTRLESAWGRP